MCSMCLWIRLRDIGPARTEVRGLHLGQQCPATWLGVIFALPQLEVHIYNYIQCIIVYIHTRLYYILLYIYYICVCVYIYVYTIYVCMYYIHVCVWISTWQCAAPRCDSRRKVARCTCSVATTMVTQPVLTINDQCDFLMRITRAGGNSA